MTPTQRTPGKTLAQLGIQLTAKSAVQNATPEPIDVQNLMGWVVPQAQTRWLAAGVAWYTPQRCEAVFRQALAGDLQSQWEMFDLMEATWPELLTCLGQLKDEVIDSKVIKLQAYARPGAKPTTEALRRHAFVQEALDTMDALPQRDENDYENSVRDLLDARGKGISILEVDWEPRILSTGLALAPRCTRWVHPLWYGYPHGPGSGDLMLRPGVGSGDPKKTWYPGDTSIGYGYTWSGNQDWQEFPDHKFLIGICKSRTGHPLASGLLHALTFWWAAFNFTAEWFFVFAQLNGQPFRWATYDSNMTPTDQMKLQAVLTNMGSNAWGMFPTGTQFELKEVAKNAGDNPNVLLLEMANKVARLLILRQTLTADVGSTGGGSKALGEVHERVEGGVVLACGRWAGRVLNTLARSICVLNFGDAAEAPTFSPEQAGEDTISLADTLSKVSQAGLEPTDEALPELGERLGFTLQRRASPAPMGFFGDMPQPQPGQDKPSGEKPEPEKKPEPGAEAEAARGTASASPVSEITAARSAALAKAYKGAMAPFREIILKSKSREDCIATLARAYADWDPKRLISEMEDAMQIAAAAGANTPSK